MTLAPADERSFQELSVAVGTVASFQSAIQHADSKAGLLAAAAAALAAFVTGHAADHLPGALTSPWRPATYVLFLVLATFAAATLTTAAALLQAVRPRIAPPPEEVNRFAFPTVARHGAPLPRATPDEMCTEAWSLATRMATIALTKHRHVRLAVYATATMAATTLPSIWLLPS